MKRGSAAGGVSARRRSGWRCCGARCGRRGRRTLAWLPLEQPQETLDAIRDYPDFPQGSRTWDERAYHPDANGVIRPLSEIWPKGHAPLSIHWLMKAVQMLGSGPVSGGLRLAWSEAAQLRLALGEQES